MLVRCFLPSRILSIVDVLPLKNFPSKQTLIGNGGNSGGGGGGWKSRKKRKARVTRHAHPLDLCNKNAVSNGASDSNISAPGPGYSKDGCAIHRINQYLVEKCYQENMRKQSDSLYSMIIIFSVFLDLAPCVEIIFNIGPLASHCLQSPWPLNGPIGLRFIDRELTQQDGWKTQDGRMMKKCRVWLGMHSLARHIFLSFCRPESSSRPVA